MYIISKHLTFLGINSDGSICQTTLDSNLPLLEVGEDTSGEINIQCNRDGNINLKVIKAHYGYHFFDGENYLCAESDKNTISINRPLPSSFETFNFVSPKNAQHILKILSSTPDEESIRFKKRVEELRLNGLPVKLYCAAGTIPRKGFLNLDIECQLYPFINSNPEDYFLFPFAQCRWMLEDASVDYIYHEDFIEHIPQIMQIQFLAETFRVLKFDCIHRISTPNLITSMQLQSNFMDGFDGVYTGELRWGHISLFSPNFLRELARMVGYKETLFTIKNQCISPFFDYDIRPNDDRHWEDGNIFVDLKK